jgi:hypothetical protein
MAGAFKLEDYVIQNADLEQLVRNQKAPKTAAKTRRTDAFAIVPLWWAARAVEDAGVPVNFMVCVDLVYRAWKAGEKPFIMPNRKGVDHKTKARTLRGLERAGLITVEWRPRKSPIITLTVSIF